MMRGGVSFDALGQPFELRFTTNAICRVEERSGKSLESLLADTAVSGKRTLAFPPKEPSVEGNGQATA